MLDWIENFIKNHLRIVVNERTKHLNNKCSS